MRNAATIAQVYGPTTRFTAVLVAAELNAFSDWECQFTNDIRARFEQYGAALMLTPLQRKQLVKLAANN